MLRLLALALVQSALLALGQVTLKVSLQQLGTFFCALVCVMDVYREAFPA